jgi:hypothetical protein
VLASPNLNLFEKSLEWTDRVVIAISEAVEAALTTPSPQSVPRLF